LVTLVLLLILARPAGIALAHVIELRLVHPADRLVIARRAARCAWGSADRRPVPQQAALRRSAPRQQ
jgi:hypothetical protein